MPLIPDIQIGKKYRYEELPIELTCPSCGVNLGYSSVTTHIVEVVDTVPQFFQDSGLCPICEVCSEPVPEAWGGWYVCLADTGELKGIPYTQLKEIEGGE